MAGRLGDILVARQLINEEQLHNALRSQGSERGMLGALLVSRGLITTDQLGSALSEQFEVPYRKIRLDEVNGSSFEAGVDFDLNAVAHERDLGQRRLGDESELESRRAKPTANGEVRVGLTEKILEQAGRDRHIEGLRLG